MSSEANTGSPPAGVNGSPAPAVEPTPDPQPEATEATGRSAPWPDWLKDVAVSGCQWLSRPRVRLTMTGVTLLLVGLLLVTSSVWTLPLVIAGALMVAIAWVGHRLDGRIAIEWGETGAQLEFRAQMRAPEHVRPPLVHAAPAPRPLVQETEPEDADVVEGEAHTVEIEVAELKALIAAAETAEAEVAQAEATAHAARILRVAHGGGRSSDAAV